MKAWIAALALIAGLAGCSEQAARENAESPRAAFEEGAAEGLKAVRVNGVTLNFRERGKGETIVFVHGALADYREWAPVAESLSGDFRTITYSRRYNYPNDNEITGGNHSPRIEARDLEAFIRKLEPEEVHVVGVSYGGFTALVLALRHPELVRTLTLVEPPLISWLSDIPGGQAEHDRLHDQLIGRSAARFREGDSEGALRAAMDYFAGPGAMDRFPEAVQAMLRVNLNEWKAIATSEEPFPPVSRKDVEALHVQVLMISGGRSYDFQKLIDAELERRLPDVKRKVVPEGTHQVCSEVPNICAAAISRHLDGG